MKKSLRFLTLILAAIFLISGAVMVVCSAAPDDGGNVAADAGEQADNGDQQSVDNAGDDEPAEPVADAEKADDDNQTGNDDQQADNDDQSGNIDQAGDKDEAGDNDQTGDNEQDGEAQQAPADHDQDSGSGDNGQSGSGDDEHAAPDNEQGGEEDEDDGYSANNYVEDEDDEPLYYGDASNYDYNIPEGDEGEAKSVSSQTSLYNTSGMSEKEAAPNQWSDIKLDEKSVKTGVADFSSIKSNTGTNDNGYWMLFLGYILIGLSVLGIAYFIVATVTNRKAVQTADRAERRRSGSPARSEAARMQEKERRESAPQKRTSRFSDEAPSYSRRASSKADTGEIYIPRRASKK